MERLNLIFDENFILKGKRGLRLTNLQTVLRSSLYIKEYPASCFVRVCSKRQSKSAQDRYLETDSKTFSIADVTTAFEQ